MLTFGKRWKNEKYYIKLVDPNSSVSEWVLYVYWFMSLILAGWQRHQLIAHLWWFAICVETLMNFFLHRNGYDFLYWKQNCCGRYWGMRVGSYFPFISSIHFYQMMLWDWVKASVSVAIFFHIILIHVSSQPTIWLFRYQFMNFEEKEIVNFFYEYLIMSQISEIRYFWKKWRLSFYATDSDFVELHI